VVVHHGDLEGTAVLPAERDTPLIVDPDRMKSFHPALEHLETIAGRYPQVAQFRGIMQEQDLAPRRPAQIRRELPHFFRLPIEEQVFCLLHSGISLISAKVSHINSRMGQAFFVDATHAHRGVVSYPETRDS
jgi:hypothetical protein